MKKSATKTRPLLAATLCALAWCHAAAQDVAASAATTTLTLDSCRALAVSNNKALRVAEMKRVAAVADRRAAATHYLPRVAAVGGYMHTGREISLLSDDQKNALANSDALGGMGSTLVEALRTDTRDAGVAAVLLTQPLYTGGRVTAYHRIARYAELVARREGDLALQEVLVAVDEAYWQIVALRAQRALAEGYLALTRRLDGDVRRQVDEGFATRADHLSVRVKVNEAEVALLQVDNGLALSRMSLCQLCGLPIDTPVVPVDEADEVAAPLPSVENVVQAAFGHRPELLALALSCDIADEKVRLTRADFLPTVTLAGGYGATNPSLFDSFEQRFTGTWGVGVTVGVPLLTSGERIHKVRAARAEARRARFQWEEACEKVELQVNQSHRKATEAASRLLAATRSCEEADENLRTATLGMREGVIAVSDVLEAQTAWLLAHSTYIAAQVDLRLADVYLRKAAGTLSVTH